LLKVNEHVFYGPEGQAAGVVSQAYPDLDDLAPFQTSVVDRGGVQDVIEIADYDSTTRAQQAWRVLPPHAATAI
jgi:hypothetical protein